MTYAQLKSVLEERQLEVAVDGAELVLRGPSAVLTSELKEAVRNHRQTFVDELSAAGPFQPDPANRYEPFPLTDIQQAYWLGRNSLFELGGVGIHVYEEVDCPALDEERLEEAWQRVIEQHDMLRSVVCAEGMQRVLPAARYRFQRDDLSTLASREQADALAAWRERLSHKVYAPEQWPLFDFVCCRLSPTLIRVFISMDAIHIDMRSFQLVFRDWLKAYREPDATLPALSIRYRDYAIAVNRLQGSAAFQRDWEYWRGIAMDLPPAPELPCKTPPRDVRDHRFERRRGSLTESDWKQLKRLGAAAGLTPSGIALAAYVEVLARWSASAAFTINVTLFNALPLHPEIGSVAGDFTSMLLIGVNADRSATFSNRARTLQDRLAAGLEHRLVSGIHVLREYNRRHGLAPHQAVFPVVFTSTLNEATRGLEPLEQLGTRVFGSIQTPQVALDLQVSERLGELVFQFDAVEKLFPEGCLDAIHQSYLDLLSALARGERWGDSDVLPADYSRRILPGAYLPAASGTLQEFCWSERHDPNSIAVIEADGRHWTRRELFERSSAIAAVLRSLEARPDEPVAIIMPKGPLQFAAVHGIVAAGAAYLPIDADWPAARIDSVLRDGDCRFAITDRPGRTGAYFSGEEIQPPSGAGAVACRFGSSASSLAYVLYTSGSTGTPKGVMIEHRSVVNRFADVLNRFAIGPADRIFAITAIHHDLSVFDLFGSIAAGASVLIPDSGRLRDPEHWAALMDRDGATVWNSVPALLEMFLEYLESRPAPPRFSIRLFLIAGDWIPVDLPDRVHRLWPDARFVSLGGPTETTVWDICHPVETSYQGWRSIPYGKPMRGARYFVMDANGVERPDWVPGELWIGGEGLARGYWRDAEKTRERFVNHPKTGERLFRSGDLGRFLPDGTIEFLGRTDHQLKVRGVRIEAGEVELALCAHPKVNQAIVQAVGGQTESKRLTAFVVRSNHPSQDRDLAEHWCLRSENRNRWNELTHAEDVDLNAVSRTSDLGIGRRCHRNFGGAVEFQALGALLAMLSGNSGHEDAQDLGRFRYPSAGSLYPVHVYIQAAPRRVDGLDAGSYLYDPWRRRLVKVSGDLLPAEAHVDHNRCMVESAAFVIFFVGHLPSIEPRYGAKSRDYCLLEAGHMSQLLMLEAGAQGLGLCPIGELDEGVLRSALRLETHDLFLQAIAGGKPAPAAAACMDWRDELARHLRLSLPENMIPEQWVAVERFPLSANGKVDRAALAALARDAALGRDASGCDAPANKVEESLARIVGDLLGGPPAPVNVRFFELGCDSIQMVRIFARIRKEESTLALSQPVRMTDLFEFPTVRMLAQHLGSAGQSGEVLEAAKRRGLARANAGRTRKF